MTSSPQFTFRENLDRSRTVRRFIISLVVIAGVLLALYLIIALSWGYSEGDRAGYLQKFSKKGWICKTYEGELAMTTVPGVAPIVWAFSVWDDDVAEQVNALLGKKVVLHYNEYRTIPTSCFGDTSYFVDRVTLATD
jgi:hypothetical protein